MKLSKNKTKATTLAIFLVLTITATLVALPIANAHTPPWTIPTRAYVTCAPSTIGVDDYTLIVMWLDRYPPTAYGQYGDRWRGYTVEITKPDGTKETIPFQGVTSQVASAAMTYTPDQIGDYTIVFSWPGQTLTNGTGSPDARGLPYVGDYYEGSTSEPFILHVQQEQIAEWVEPPLPTGYWTRPIPTANREWAQLTSNWLGSSWLRYSGFQEWGQAPNSPHVLYAKEIIHGGIADEIYYGVKYDTTDYENFFPNPIVMSGKIYYNAGTYPNYGYYCVDLRTGETTWYKNGTDNGLNNPFTWSDLASRGPTLAQSFVQLSFGQLYHYHSINGEGIKDHLWMTQMGTPQTATSGGTMWYMLDANTGNWVMSLKNVPGGTSVTDQDGSLLLYSYNPAKGNFLCWNVSQSIPPGGPAGTEQQQWEPRTGAVIDAVNDRSWTEWGLPPVGGPAIWYADDILPRSGYTMNVTGPKGLPTGMRVLQDENKVPKLIVLNYFSGVQFIGGSTEQRFEIAVVRIDEHVAPYSPFPDKSATQNTNLGFGVTLQWHKNFTYPQTDNRSWSLGPISYEDKVFTIYCQESRQWWGYSLDDGSLLWGPTEPQPEWDFYGSGGFYAYGTLYSGGYGGVLCAYDIKTGKLKWNYTLAEIGHESPYGNFQISFGGVADGKVYLYSSEHSPTQPLWRGSYLRCINATDGTEIWKILNFVSGMSIADGCIVAGNNYDNRMYVYGKGPSATTVAASPKVSVHGNNVLIEGMVTDQSPGATAIATKLGYTYGVPAIADADQEAWMEYLYMQQACPTNFKGVEVTLDTLDPNGNFVHIDTVTSDSSGGFKKMWTPEVPGEYTIIATFAGSESYGSSYAQTYVGVSEAPPATAAPEYPQPIDNTWTIVGIGIILLIAIVLVGIWIKRK